MAELSRAQIVVYGALAVVALLLGSRWIRGQDADVPDGSVAFAGQRGGAEIEARAGDVVVHVAGAVGNPGVYRLPSGSRVADAIERAGGVTRGGAQDAINLAAELSDGQQVVVPQATGPAGGAAAVSGASTDGPISLGTATAEQLDTIEGIGPVTAQQILEFRDQHGVGSIEDLDQISGIGPTTMEALRAGLQP